MHREALTNPDGSITLIEDEASVTFSRDEGLTDAVWLARIDEASTDFFTPVDADGEPMTGAALWWHRTMPAWLRWNS